jgi:hypothetical protein
MRRSVDLRRLKRPWRVPEGPRAETRCHNRGRPWRHYKGPARVFAMRSRTNLEPQTKRGSVCNSRHAASFISSSENCPRPLDCAVERSGDSGRVVTRRSPTPPIGAAISEKC